MCNGTEERNGTERKIRQSKYFGGAEIGDKYEKSKFSHLSNKKKTPHNRTLKIQSDPTFTIIRYNANITKPISEYTQSYNE